MAKVFIEESSLSNIGNAIRNKLSISTTFKPSQMAAAIDTIPVADNQLQDLIEGTITTATSPVVTVIKNYCFVGCSSLSTAIFPRVSVVGMAAFSYCSALKTATFPEAIEIKQSAFVACTNLASISIPKVTSIGSSAFYSCKSLASISLPQVKSIASGAFTVAGLSGVLELPECTYIGNSAIYNNPKLTAVIAPKVDIIESNAFYGCSNLSSAELPSSVWFNIGLPADKGIFRSCGFTEISNPYIIRCGNTFMECNKLSKVNLPNCIAINLNSCAKLTEVSLPLAYSATFSYCNALEELDLPRYSSASASDFYSCYKLSRLNIPQLVSILSTYSYNYTFMRAGESAVGGLSLNAPYLTTVGLYTFYNCLLTRANFPHLLGQATNTLSSSAFYSCSKLSTVELLDISNISGNAFAQCRSLASLYLRNMKPVTAAGYPFAGTPLSASTLLGYFGSVYVPAGTKSKYPATWAGLPVASRFVELPFESEYIYANEYAGDLTIASVPEEKASTAIRIGASAFAGCTSLLDATLPEADSIGHWAFNGCTALTTVSVPKVKFIGNSAFSNCVGLTRLDLPEVEIIGASAFKNCSNLSVINASKVVYTLPNAFDNAAGLTEISFPEATYVSGTGLTNLEVINLPKASVIPSFGTKIRSIYAPRWEGAQLKISNCTSFEYINAALSIINTSSAFCNNPNLSYVEFSNLSYIGGSDIFKNCPNLEFISFPRLVSMSTLSTALRISTSKVSQITFPELTIAGGYYAIQDCSNLEEINIPKLSNRAANAASPFIYNCSNLKRFNISEATTLNLTSLATLLANCGTSLEEFHAPKAVSGRNLHNLMITMNTTGGYSDSYHLKIFDMSALTTAAWFSTTNNYIETGNAEFVDLRAFSGSLPLRPYGNLKSVRLDNLTDIGKGFAGCYNLTELNLPNVSLISANNGGTLFQNCNALSRLNLQNCTSFYAGASTFRNCSALTELNLPRVSYIHVNSASMAFSGCALSILSLPACILISGSTDLLKAASSLTELRFGSQYCSINSANPLAIPAIMNPSFKMYVPSSLYAQYQADNHWSYYWPYMLSY